jgi:hypothetical protein
MPLPNNQLLDSLPPEVADVLQSRIDAVGMQLRFDRAERQLDKEKAPRRAP